MKPFVINLPSFICIAKTCLNQTTNIGHKKRNLQNPKDIGNVKDRKYYTENINLSKKRFSKFFVLLKDTILKSL